MSKKKIQHYTVHWEHGINCHGFNPVMAKSAREARALHRRQWPADAIVKVHRGPVFVHVSIR